MTVPFVPLGVPKDTTGRTPKMLAGFRGRDVTDGPEVPSSQRSLTRWSHQFFSNFGATAKMGVHAAGDEDVECARVRVDNAGMGSGRWRMQSHVIVAGDTTAEYVTRYSIDGGTSFADGPKVSLATASLTLPRMGGWVIIPNEAAISDLLLKLVRRGGNGLSPETWNALIEAASTNPNPPTSGPGSDLPAGMVPLLDLDPARLTGYGSGDSVFQWDDFSGNDNHAAPVSASPYFQLPGMFKPNEFGPGVHGVRIDGAGDGFAIEDVPDGFNNQTWYFVFKETDGGGNNGNGQNPNGALLITAGIGGENGWVTVRDDGRLQTGINASVFEQTGTLGNTDNFNGSSVHVVSVVWNQTGFTWTVYGDRTLNHSIGGPVVGNNWVNVARIMFGNAATNPNLITTTYGRVLCLPGAHDATQRTTMWDYFSSKYGAP